MSGARPDTWMPLYWGDYHRDTAHLSAAEHGAYLLLIGHYWTTGKPLQDDDSRLARVARMSPKEWKAARVVLEDFFDVSDCEWRHGRVESELAKANARTEAKAEAGRKGAAKRWRDNGTANGKANSSAMAEPSVSQCRTDAQSQPHISDTSVSAPSDLKSIIFNQGLDWVAERSGKPPVKLRPLFGRWCRDYGDAATAEALMSAQREGAVEPVGWIEKTLEARNGKRQRGGYIQQLSDAFASDDTSP